MMENSGTAAALMGHMTLVSLSHEYAVARSKVGPDTQSQERAAAALQELISYVESLRAPSSAEVDGLTRYDHRGCLLVPDPTGDYCNIADVRDLLARRPGSEESAEEIGKAVAQARDAARYRWLRNNAARQFEHPIVVDQHHAVGQGMRYIGPLISRELDKKVDAAIAAMASEGSA